MGIHGPVLSRTHRQHNIKYLSTSTVIGDRTVKDDSFIDASAIHTHHNARKYYRRPMVFELSQQCVCTCFVLSSFNNRLGCQSGRVGLVSKQYDHYSHHGSHDLVLPTHLDIVPISLPHGHFTPFLCKGEWFLVWCGGRQREARL
jgi:hypothetical protein